MAGAEVSRVAVEGEGEELVSKELETGSVPTRKSRVRRSGGKKLVSL